MRTEAWGRMGPGGAAMPAVVAERGRLAEDTGKRAVAMAAEKLTPDKIVPPAAVKNALRVMLAAGGSTNALVHMTAIAGRAGIKVDLEAFDRMGRETPVLVDLKPTGKGYMEDLHRAGGLAPMLRELTAQLALDAMTVTGQTLGANIENAAKPFKQDVIKPFAEPVYFHQVKSRAHDGSLGSWPDLSDALAERGAETVRIHFHVPLFWQGSCALRSTSACLTPAFGKLVRAGGKSHL